MRDNSASELRKNSPEQKSEETMKPVKATDSICSMSIARSSTDRDWYWIWYRTNDIKIPPFYMRYIHPVRCNFIVAGRNQKEKEENIRGAVMYEEKEGAGRNMKREIKVKVILKPGYEKRFTEACLEQIRKRKAVAEKSA